VLRALPLLPRGAPHPGATALAGEPLAHLALRIGAAT
jgi:hypothetical protein